MVDESYPESVVITFPRSYDAPPQLIVWLTGFDFESNSAGVYVTPWDTKITAKYFVVEIDSDNNAFREVSFNWIA